MPTIIIEANAHTAIIRSLVLNISWFIRFVLCPFQTKKGVIGLAIKSGVIPDCFPGIQDAG
ncbi:MAG: hypothetical protein HZB42_09910 [Sphingobacteriales bacterium]|nr:hypothetical protein [Sphingobacteriales bacterium]